jgi:hypothetical protein
MSTGPDADQAVPHDTPAVPSSPWVMPGKYTVRLIAGGKTQTQPLTVMMDPRVKTSTADLEAQFKISKRIYDDALKATAALHEITMLREQLKTKATKDAETTAGEGLDKKLEALVGHPGFRRGGPAGPPTITAVRMQLARVEHSIQNADVAPTTAQVEAYETLSKPLASLLEQWNTLKTTDLKNMNALLQRDHLPTLRLDTNRIDHDVEDQIELGDVE